MYMLLWVGLVRLFLLRCRGVLQRAWCMQSRQRWKQKLRLRFWLENFPHMWCVQVSDKNALLNYVAQTNCAMAMGFAIPVLMGNVLATMAFMVPTVQFATLLFYATHMAIASLVKTKVFYPPYSSDGSCTCHPFWGGDACLQCKEVFDYY